MCEKSVCACVRAHYSRLLGTFQRNFRAELLAYLGIRLTDSKYSISVNGHKYVSITVTETRVLFSLGSVKVLVTYSSRLKYYTQSSYIFVSHQRRDDLKISSRGLNLNFNQANLLISR